MLNQLQKELFVAMKAGEKAKMMGLRNIIGKLKAAKIDKGESLTNEESLIILKSASKQLKESIDQYQKGGRDDLAEEEAYELSLLEQYLPKQISEEIIRYLIETHTNECGVRKLKELLFDIIGEINLDLYK